MGRLVDFQKSVQLEGLSVETRSVVDQGLDLGLHFARPVTTLAGFWIGGAWQLDRLTGEVLMVIVGARGRRAAFGGVGDFWPSSKASVMLR